MSERVDRHLAKLIKGGHIETVDANLIKDYLADAMGRKGIGEQTALTDARYLTKFLRDLGGGFNELTQKEVLILYSRWRRELKPTTFNSMYVQTRQFLEWMGMNRDDICVKREKVRTNKTAAGMLTLDEVQAMINAAWTSRNRAIISLLYESGMRPVELVRLTWGEVKFDEHGAIINTSEKTGIPRYIRIISCAPYLAQWQADYPGTPEKEARVFLRARAWQGKRGTPITVSTITHLVDQVCARAGIKKNVYPYLFKHSRITHMLEAGIPESVIKLQEWGSLTTNMLSTYAHVSNTYLDDVLLEQAGIRTVQTRKKDQILKPVQCPNCETINPPGANRCYVCGLLLSERAKATRAKMLQSIREDPQLLADIIEEVKKGGD